MYNHFTRRKFVRTTAAGAVAALTSARLLSSDNVSAVADHKTKKRRWIDTHIHVSDIGRDGRKRERMLEDLLDVLDRCDADLRFVISSDNSGGMKTDPAAILKVNQEIHDLCRNAPGRLYGSCMVNPNFPDESLRVMKICFEEWGFVQFGEMLPYIHNYRMNDPGTEKVVQQAAKYQVPVQVHLGTYWYRSSKPFDAGDGMNQMGDFLDLAERVPDAKYILAHAIGCGPTKESISWADMSLDALNGFFPEYPANFWVEIRDFQAPALPRTLREVPVTRILSGTDWTTRIGPPFQPYGTMFEVRGGENPFPPEVSSFVGFLKKAGATETDIERIGYENARELYRLSS